MSDTNRENDPMDEFLSTLGDEPQETKVLRVPEVIPTIQSDAANTESNAGPDGQTPLEVPTPRHTPPSRRSAPSAAARSSCAVAS